MIVRNVMEVMGEGPQERLHENSSKPMGSGKCKARRRGEEGQKSNKSKEIKEERRKTIKGATTVMQQAFKHGSYASSKHRLTD